MIRVIATVRIRSGKRNEFLDAFRENTPTVLKEAGCIEYVSTVDSDVGLPVQTMDERVVTIIEKWENPEALRHHLAAPHMRAYKAKTQDIVESVSIKVLQEI